MLSTTSIQQGVTLIELLIGLAVGIVLTFGMVVFYTNTSRISNENLTTTRLEFEMQITHNYLRKTVAWLQTKTIHTQFPIYELQSVKRYSYLHQCEV